MTKRTAGIEPTNAIKVLYSPTNAQVIVLKFTLNFNVAFTTAFKTITSALIAE